MHSSCEPVLKGYRRCENGLWRNAHDEYDYVKPSQKLEKVKLKAHRLQCLRRRDLERETTLTYTVIIAS